MPANIQTIQHVIDELNIIIDHCIANNSRQGYFAALYKCMTEAVLRGIEQNAFEDAARMEMLDVKFANRYIDAWHCYQQKQSCSGSWQHAFDICESNGLIVLQHIILGINTHINLDLAIAAAETAPGENIFQLQKDFEKINSIIADLTDDVQSKLEKIWWPMKLLRKITNGRDEAVINFSITSARKASWANAVALASVQGPASANYITGIDNTVLGIGKCVVKPEWYKQWLIRFVSWFEEKDTRRVIGYIR
jgi:hypothetical protein